MDKTIVQEQATLLFNRRISEVQTFWEEMTLSKQRELIGTSLLIDGEPGILEQLVEQYQYNDKILYNLYKFYEEQPAKKNYYKNGIKDSKLIKKNKENKTKNIAIFLPHCQWTGGMKMIFSLGDLLRAKGYTVDFYIPYNTNGQVYELEVGPFRATVISYKEDEFIPTFASNYDIAIATHWDLIYPLYLHFDKAIFYNQGDYSTFSNQESTVSILKCFYSLPVYHMGVSSFITHLLKDKFQRKSWIVPCGIDLNKFNYNEELKKENYILIIGDGLNAYKNVYKTIENLLPVAIENQMKIYWITPRDDQFEHENVIKIVNPKQQELVRYIQQANVLVNGSLIEAFGLPALEAMACGTPVVSSNNMGILQFGIKGENCFIYTFNEFDKMREYVSTILNDKEVSQSFIDAGLSTAAKYDISLINEQNLELMEKEFFDKKYLV
ncbi:glycosyltransferase family 4 protein [Bacillus sp. Brlt_9]|uniref:glycosyltransferase family 4 protein n=1 Tax=Bacillus sp. Brlt_9 TaxID=3110916 RepID=UPI003F7C1E10